MRSLLSKLFKRNEEDGFFCKSCGKFHKGLPFSYGAEAPAYWYDIPEHERQRRCSLDDETCVIDNEFFFVKGNIEIPLRDKKEIFVWTVWISLSQENFDRAMHLWKEPERVNEEPYFGWLSTSLRGYPETQNLKTNFHFREPGRRSWVELEPTDHPLAVEQREGITMARVREIAQFMLHPKK